MQILRAELTGDPLARGYAPMTDAEAANDLNTVYRTSIRETLESWEVFQAIDEAEWTALNSANKAKIQVLLDMGAVKAKPPSRAVDWVLAAFGAGSATVANIVAVRDSAISRAQELGLGSVRPGEVAMARGL